MRAAAYSASRVDAEVHDGGGFEAEVHDGGASVRDEIPEIRYQISDIRYQISDIREHDLGSLFELRQTPSPVPVPRAVLLHLEAVRVPRVFFPARR